MISHHIWESVFPFGKPDVQSWIQHCTTTRESVQLIVFLKCDRRVASSDRHSVLNRVSLNHHQNLDARSRPLSTIITSIITIITIISMRVQGHSAPSSPASSPSSPSSRCAFKATQHDHRMNSNHLASTAPLHGRNRNTTRNFLCVRVLESVCKICWQSRHVAKESCNRWPCHQETDVYGPRRGVQNVGVLEVPQSEGWQ